MAESNGPSSGVVWGTCTTCGDATPPGRACPTCGAEPPEAVRSGRPLPRRTRRWLATLKTFRVLIVVGAVIGLSYAILQPLQTGPPQVADPLSGHWMLTIAPGNSSAVSGAITGADYVTGNYTVAAPPGALASFEVFNATEYRHFEAHEAATPANGPFETDHGRIVFSATLTDTYFFVFTNVYSPPTGIVEHVYVSTMYETNVAVE